MKFLRWAAVAVLSLMSLMNVGVLAEGDDGPSAAVVTGAVLLGVFGFVAVYGLLRREPWGRPAAIAAGVLNLVGGIVAMANDSDGAIAGVVLGALIVVLSFAAGDGSPAQRQSALG